VSHGIHRGTINGEAKGAHETHTTAGHNTLHSETPHHESDNASVVPWEGVAGAFCGRLVGAISSSLNRTSARKTGRSRRYLAGAGRIIASLTVSTPVAVHDSLDRGEAESAPTGFLEQPLGKQRGLPGSRSRGFPALTGDVGEHPDADFGIGRGAQTVAPRPKKGMIGQRFMIRPIPGAVCSLLRAGRCGAMYRHRAPGIEGQRRWG